MIALEEYMDKNRIVRRENGLEERMIKYMTTIYSLQVIDGWLSGRGWVGGYRPVRVESRDTTIDCTSSPCWNQKSFIIGLS